MAKLNYFDRELTTYTREFIDQLKNDGLHTDERLKKLINDFETEESEQEESDETEESEEGDSSSKKSISIDK